MKLNHNYSSRFRILKGGKISLIVSALFGSAILSFASPSVGVVTSGNATINQVAKTTNINQSTSKASINWQKFGIKADEVVNFIQPDKNSITLNRVVGNERSIIDGALNANGQVWILNSNGVLFGKDASINTSGILTTTKNLSDEDFNKGNYIFSGDSTESIINQGTIKIKDNGYVIFASNEVRNSGTIEAVKGRVQLTSANEYTINLNGNSLVDLVVDKGTLDALVENSGTILADAGEIYLSTHAVDELLRGVVNNTGIIEANSLDGISGHVELFAHGGTANIAGTIKAKGGFIETSGKELNVASTTLVEASKWLLDPTNMIIESTGGTDLSGASVSATAIQSALSSADVELQADQDITVNENITWGDATKLTLKAGDEIYVNATIENTNATNGGVYFNAVNRNAAIKFDATTGKVIINNINQLQWINQALNGNYELGSNIDASDTRNWNSDYGFKQIGDNSTNNIDTRFTGNFDGKGYIIDGLYINRPSENHVGLFGNANGYGANSATILNLGLTNLYVKGGRYIGGLIGESDNNTLISNSYVTGEVIGAAQIGGLIGNARSTTINNSYTNTTMSSENTSGGLVGYAFSNLNISNSYAIGKINLGGGLIGYSNNINNTITNSYYDIDTTGVTSGVGTGSYSGSFTGIYSSTNTVNAFNQPTYAGFDFTNDWFMIEGETRPFLRSEYSTTITNDHQLQLMAMDLTANYTLANDIKYTGDMWSSKGFDPIGDSSKYFTGTFDGKSHVIDGLYINRGSESRVGLFGQNWSSKSISKSISNLGLTNVDITGKDDVGGLVGNALNLTINNSYVTGTINGHDSVGGLIGYAYNNTSITDSYATVNLTGNGRVGGLLGYKNSIFNLSISDSYTTGNIKGNGNVGGLLGYFAGTDVSTISNSYSTATVFSSGDYIGGLVGYENYVYINNSYASGDVSGHDNVGGLVGYSNRGQINNSYPSGNVSGDDNIGGLVGLVYGTTINNSYSSGDITGNHKVGGLVGFYDGYETISNSYASGAITGVSRVGGVVGALSSTASILNPILNSYWDIDTTGQALGVGDGDTAGTTGIYSSTNTINAFDEATYAGFDFTNDWIIYEGDTRPLLRTFMTELTVKANDATRTYDGTTYSGSGGVTYSNPTYDNSLVKGTLNYTSSDDLRNAGTATINVDGLYSSQHGYIISYDTGTLTTNKKDITTNFSASDKVYDGTTNANVNGTLSGVISGDDITLDSFLASFSDKNVGNNKTVNITGISLGGTDIANYSFGTSDTTTTANISPKTLTANFTVSDKTYDGTTSANASLNGGLSGIISGDNVTLNSFSASFSDKNVGNNKTINISNISLGGTSSSNYTIASSSSSTASITPKNISATFSASDKVYDGTTSAVVDSVLSGVILGDDITISQTASFTDKDAGENKTVSITDISLGGTDITNYSFDNSDTTTTASINKALATVTVDNKEVVYDGNTHTIDNYTVSGLVNNEDKSVLDSISISGSGRNAGTYTILALGEDDNYNLEFIDGALTITPKSILATFTANDKEYDGSTTAIANGSLSGVIQGDDIKAIYSSANFEDEKPANNKNVYIQGISLTGTDSQNYTLLEDSFIATANINNSLGSLIASIINGSSINSIEDFNNIDFNSLDINSEKIASIQNIITDLLQQGETSFPIINGIVLKVLDGGINMPYGTQRQLILDEDEEENKKKGNSI